MKTSLPPSEAAKAAARSKTARANCREVQAQLARFERKAIPAQREEAQTEAGGVFRRVVRILEGRERVSR